MSNITQEVRIVIKKGQDITPERGYDLVILRKGNYEIYPEGQVPTKRKFLMRLVDNGSFEVFAVDIDSSYDLTFKKGISHYDGIHNFFVKIDLVYEVNDPIIIVKYLRQDPVSRLKEEAGKVISSFLRNTSWEIIRNPNHSRELRLSALEAVFTTASGRKVLLFDRIENYSKEFGINLLEIDFQVMISENDLAVEIAKDHNEKEKLISNSDTDKELHIISNEHQKIALRNNFRRSEKIKDQLAKTATNFIDKVGSNIAENSRSLEDVKDILSDVKEVESQITSKEASETLKEGRANINDISGGREGNISYELPTTMKVFEEHEVQVRIADASVNIEEVKIDSKSPVEDTIISNKMIVELIEVANDPVLQVKQISTSVQTVLGERFSEWFFVVKPLKRGRSMLMIRVSTVDTSGQIIRDVKNIRKEISIIQDDESIAKRLELLLSNNKVGQVVEQLLILFAKDKGTLHELILLSRQHAELEHMIRCNLISYSESLIIKNKTCYSLLQIIEKIK